MSESTRDGVTTAPTPAKQVWQPPMLTALGDARTMTEKGGLNNVDNSGDSS